MIPCLLSVKATNNISLITSLEAFSRVKSSEWVVFYLAHTQASNVTEITSGAFFAQNGYLHLLIANYRYAVTVPLLQQQIRDHPLRPKGEGFYEFVPRVKQAWPQNTPGICPNHSWQNSENCWLRWMSYSLLWQAPSQKVNSRKPRRRTAVSQYCLSKNGYERSIDCLAKDSSPRKNTS